MVPDLAEVACASIPDQSGLLVYCVKCGAATMPARRLDGSVVFFDHTEPIVSDLFPPEFTEGGPHHCPYVGGAFFRSWRIR